ncbi:MAG: SPOR domain-containing protein, partial [Geminicoccaceae bacterium]
FAQRQDGEITGAAGGPENPIITAATDIEAVTPRRSSSEDVDAGTIRRGSTETAKADPADLERATPTASKPTASKDVEPPSKRIYRVQLAAVDTENAAEVYWREAKTRLPQVLDGIEPMFNQREVGKRMFFRIWIGSFDKHADADNYCDWLKSKGQDCFVTLG